MLKKFLKLFQQESEPVKRTLIVGLGNPGAKYDGTRHNIGFEALKAFASRHHLEVSTQKFHGFYGTGRALDKDLVVLMPQTFMNRSGKSVQAAMSFFSIDVNEIYVLHDELDLDVGALKIKTGGGHGGHNGLRDIIQMTGGKDFHRLRLGIGRPTHGNVTGHVLGRFGEDERILVDDLLLRAVDALEIALTEGVGTAQNRFH